MFNLTKLIITPAILDIGFQSATDFFPFGIIKQLEVIHDINKHWEAVPKIDVWRTVAGSSSSTRHLSNTLVSYSGPVPKNLDVLATAFPNLEHIGVTRLESEDDDLIHASKNMLMKLQSVAFRSFLPNDCNCSYYYCHATSPIERNQHTKDGYFTWIKHQLNAPSQFPSHADVAIIIQLLNEYVVNEEKTKVVILQKRELKTAWT
jgi:hypothetical protein